MRHRRLVTFFGGIFVFVGVMFFWKLYDAGTADTFLAVLTPVGMITAVAFAVYGDPLRAWFYPVDLRIEVLKPDECNHHLDEGGFGTKYCHHLRVKNLTPNKTIENCRVWLKSITIKHETTASQPDENIVFAVPQLMEWAPSEYDRDKRTFGKDQIFDLGYTGYNMSFEVGESYNGFMFTIDRNQGAALKRLKTFGDKFGPGATLECAIYATADNYHAQEEFRFRISVKRLKILPGTEKQFEASEISPANHLN